ncbi:MAG: hypothetical protein ACRDRP_14420 [Pseudonocardiaceae bacterium]
MRKTYHNEGLGASKPTLPDTVSVVAGVGSAAMASGSAPAG